MVTEVGDKLPSAPDCMNVPVPVSEIGDAAAGAAVSKRHGDSN
jgi:hypothetical protein